MRFQDEFLMDELKNNKLQVKLPCSSCNADCCGPVPVTTEKVESLFEKYKTNKDFKKRFPWPEKSLHKNLKYIAMNIPGMVYLTYKYKNDLKKIGLTEMDCIFKKDPKTGGCLIYEDRPEVCKAYGLVTSIQCPYNGLDKQPDDLVERERLINEYHLKSRNGMMEAYQCGRLNSFIKTEKDKA